MAEILAAALAVAEACSLAEQIFNTGKSVKDRISHALKNPQRAHHLIQLFQRFSEELKRLKTECDNHPLSILDDKLQFFTVRIKQLTETLQNTLQKLEEKEHKLASLPYRVSRAKSTAEWFAQLDTTAHRADQILRDVMSLFTILDVARDQTEEVNRHTTTTAVQVVQAIQKRVEAGSNHPKDEFCASFDVPENPPHVVLNFQSESEVDGDAPHPVTIEAKLKKTVLRSGDSSEITERTRSSLAHMIGIEGMSGIGKSCALRGLATDADVRRRFKDGLYYMSVGKDATQKIVIEEIAKIVALSGGLRRSRTVREQVTTDAAVPFGRRWFEGKRTLLLIDDVWEHNDVCGDILLALSTLVDASAGSRVVFTTRDGELTSDCDQVHFPTRDEHVSRQILLAAARLREADIKPFRAKVEDVRQSCGGHPFALAIAGRTVETLIEQLKKRFNRTPTQSEMEKVWDKYSSELEGHREYLLKKKVVYDQYKGLKAAFSASLSVLDEKVSPQLSSPFTLSEMYRRLVVNRRQGWLPVHVLQRLWYTKDMFVTEDVLQILANANLAQCEYRVLNGETSMGLSIHDLQLDFVQNECEEKGELEKWHRMLVRSFVPFRIDSDSCSESWNFENTCQDEYMRNNICRHLRNGGLLKELFGLLKDPRWVVARLRAHEILGLDEDVGMLPESAGKQGVKPESGVRDDWALRMIARAARLSFPYVSQNQREVWFQLHARLQPLSEQSEVLKQFIQDIERFAEKPWVKALTACLTGPGSALKSTVLYDGEIKWISGVDDEGKLFACGWKYQSEATILVSEFGRSFYAGSCAYVSTIRKGLIKDTVCLSGSNPAPSLSSGEEGVSGGGFL